MIKVKLMNGSILHLDNMCTEFKTKPDGVYFYHNDKDIKTFLAEIPIANILYIWNDNPFPKSKED